jgi:phosphoserine aminotransferase
VDAARGHIRDILSIPNDYHIWFLGGGCHLQFAGIPLNFLGNNPNATANYTTTGYFSKLSFSEAKRYCNAKSISTLTADEQGYFYLADKYDFDPNAAYTHFIDNESVEGLSYSVERYPKAEGIPLFNDCSSSFLTR